jgi:subfamily B ATP-binding cassette protein HlyB/CyaB
VVQAATAENHFDDGVAALCLTIRFLGVPADPVDIGRRFVASGMRATGEDLVRAARKRGLKARLASIDFDRLSRTPMPALAILNDGRFLVVGLVSDDKVLVQDLAAPRPEHLARAEFEALWSGRMILLARRANAQGEAPTFNLRWFITAVQRYRRALSEVLVASFFIQLIGLASPLFFQVVVDKVLVHRGLSTLDVLMIGLAIISIFEVVLGALRTYLFSHTTNRIDVELGARVFDHLLGLPIGYFANRRVGDSVARVRELETIRTFITGSSLTLTIDLFFTLVFLGVMFLYSATLTWIVIGSLPLYVAISVIVTPIFRTRLDEKFARGAENQAFLVEAVSGAETLKAMAIEPQMQRRWEEQLATYIRASFSTQNLGNVASQSVQFVNKATTVLKGHDFNYHAVDPSTGREISSLFRQTHSDPGAIEAC